MQLMKLMVIALAITGCQVVQRLPIKSAEIMSIYDARTLSCLIAHDTERLELNHLSSTSSQRLGTMNTIRVMGDGYEVTIYNPSGGTAYRVDLFDMSGRGVNSERSVMVFDHVSSLISGQRRPIENTCIRP